MMTGSGLWRKARAVWQYLEVKGEQRMGSTGAGNVGRSCSTHEQAKVTVSRMHDEERRLCSAVACAGFSHHIDLKEKTYGDQR
jgi:hypothetical protein